MWSEGEAESGVCVCVCACACACAVCGAGCTERLAGPVVWCPLGEQEIQGSNLAVPGYVTPLTVPVGSHH